MNTSRWETVEIRAQLSERVAASQGAFWPNAAPEAVAQYAAEALQHHETRILRLPTPIVSHTADIIAICDKHVDGKRIRIYPPFPIDLKQETKAGIERTWIPEGTSEVSAYRLIDPTTPIGLSSTHAIGQGTHFCHGLRTDYELDANYRQTITLLLDNICQYTNQWWLRARWDPFSGPSRASCELNRDFSFRQILYYAGAGDFPSPWRASHDTQRRLGFERALTPEIWRRSFEAATAGTPAEEGLLCFYDAINYKLAGDERLFILHLALTVEILGNKRRLMTGQKPVELRELLRTSDLIEPAFKKTIQSLFVDRGHIAHGRAPHYSPTAPATSTDVYLGAVQALRLR